MNLLPIAESLAADLAGARVDPNEAQKALAYLRSKKDGRQFFDYMRAIVNGGRAVIRSGQTLGYYRDLLAACERHLRGMEAGEMAQTLGWAIRLPRYYRAVPEAAQQIAAEVRFILTQADRARPLADVARELADAAALTPEEWQTQPLLLNPPALAPLALALIAELHGRRGYFPPILNIRPVPDALPTRYEVAELVNLQAPRDMARNRR